MIAAPYYFCEEMFWHICKRCKPWDSLFPRVSKRNERRKGLIKIVLLMLDEIMPGWRPTNSKLVTLPN